ncbi:hypothetical protein T552_02136 [Pneumocystis carinii B80]|uniref:CUE domain-containing protein n=1 Tax=Pneumocystis carinii (strain B80) TaxID=1408658 RepID=A0A0W4ZH47_PNEC8|nr:hypothetical protein T552_02136 [Pneumocystis carinii B80]KTW27696.1 hypothetical protein T552_02136 [Pneumocystis carinii B80]
MHITRYPCRDLRVQIGENEWKHALDMWNECIEYFMSISDVEFRYILDDRESETLYEFIKDYLDAHTPRKHVNLMVNNGNEAEERLEKNVFSLIYKIFTLEQPNIQIFEIPFVIFDFCSLFGSSSTECVFFSLENLYKYAKNEVFLQIQGVYENFQELMNKLVFLKGKELIEEALMYRVAIRSLIVFIQLCFPATCVFLQDEEFLQLMVHLYHENSIVDEMKSDFLCLVYTLFTAFLSENEARLLIIKRFVWLYEQLSLETALLRDLVLDTSIVERFYEFELFSEEIMSQLRILRENTETNDSKRSLDSYLDPSIRRLSLISHIKDIFPDCTEEFIESCLKKYCDDVEAVISYILENSFSSNICSVDKKASNFKSNGGELSKDVSKMPVYHKDDTNVFVDCPKIYKGKKIFQTADDILKDKSFVREYKQTILDLELLNQDDERDDTYDDVDEFINLESSQEKNSNKLMDNMDEILYLTYIVSPEVFERGSHIRRSSARIELRSKTGFSDEQIEGWKIMLDRNPKRIEKLENMLKFSGDQDPIPLESKEQDDKFNKNSQISQFSYKKGKKNK